MEQKQSALFSAIAYSYAYFIDDYLAVLKNPAYNSCEYIDEDIHNILKEMKTLFLSMPSLLGSEEAFKEEYAKKLVSFREVLEYKYRSLSSYKRELQHITSFFNLKNSLDESTYADFGMTEEDARDMNFDMLAKDCSTFVFASSDPVERQDKAASLLLHVPMRMTKESFLSYVEKGLHKIAIDESEESALFLTSILRQQFSGHLFEYYGKDFADMAISLEELTAITDVDTFFEHAELLNETMDYTVDIVTHLHHMICTFSNLLIFDALTFDTLTDMHLSFYDLYCSLQTILEQKEDKDIFLEALPERVNILKEELATAYEKANQTSDIDPLRLLMHTYLSMSITQVFGFDTAKHDAYTNVVTDVFRDFLGELKENLNVLPPAERKIRMQYFMSVLPFMMNDQTFYTYLTQGFSGSAHPKRNLYTAMYLSSVLEQGGYFEALEQAENEGYTPYDPYAYLEEEADQLLGESDHHEHGDNCNCGHDHSTTTHTHDDGHECCGGHGHDDDHECCGGHDCQCKH